MARGGIPVSMQKALNEGDDSEGGYTVPEEFSNEVIRYASEASVVRARARVFNMTRDIYSAPKLDQDSVGDGDHFGGVVFYYTAESGTGTESAPRFGKVKLEAKKLVGLTVATDELLEDSAVNIANFLVSLFGEALGFKEDIDFLQGTGMGKPLGVINAAGITSVTRNTANRIKYQDILGMEQNLLSAFDRNSVWMTTKAGRGQIVQIQVDTTSALVFQPSLRDGYPDTLLGRPFIVVDNAKLPALGTTGDILLGDFSQYYIGDRGAMKVSSSIHDRFRQDETVFKFVKRFDGQPAIPKAFVKLTT
jgi:HK97 family phage major capsid protein